MTHVQVAKFLAAQADVPRALCAAILRMHGGRWPLWRALTLTRGVSQIVALGLEQRRDGDARSIAVVRWFWNDRGVGLTWRNFAKARAARAYHERAFSVDRAHLDVRA